MAKHPAGAGFAAGLTSVILAASVVGLAPPAAAGTQVSMQVNCVLPLDQGEHQGEQLVTLDGPTEAVRPGDKVKIRVTLGPNVATSPIPLPGTPLTPSMELTLSGGATGTVRLFGPQMLVDIPGHPNQIVVPPYEGELTIPIEANGDIAIAPGRMITTTQVFGVQTTTCTPLAPPPVSTTIRITAQDAPLGPAAGPAGTTGQQPQTSAPVVAGSELPAFSTATASGPTVPEASSATIKAAGSDASDGGGMSGAALFGIAAGALVLLMAIVTMLMSWRRHTEDD
ncbi:MAG: hypothetical protein HOV68_13685 [Streptomycetaceae bacterium]|nr:hypothetical protein [Streptomycetaceae bacterium]